MLGSFACYTNILILLNIFVDVKMGEYMFLFIYQNGLVPPPHTPPCGSSQIRELDMLSNMGGGMNKEDVGCPKHALASLLKI